MTYLGTFLLARFAEDEATVRAAVERNGATWSSHKLQEGARIRGTTEFGNPRSHRGDGELWDDEGALGMFVETAEHIVRWNPARVLAECEAKRRIVEMCTWVDYERHEVRRGVYEQRPVRRPRTDDDDLEACEGVLRAIALPYADHPDFSEEWRR